MRSHHVGNLVIIEKRKKPYPVGLISDRDLVVEVMALGLNPEELAAADIVTRSLLVVTADLMREKGVRRLPVVNVQGSLVGITLNDVTDVG